MSAVVGQEGGVGRGREIMVIPEGSYRAWCFPALLPAERGLCVLDPRVWF